MRDLMRALLIGLAVGLVFKFLLVGLIVLTR